MAESAPRLYDVAMKVGVLSYADVSGWIAAILIGRGHEVAFVSGGVHEAALDALDGYDGCLLLGEEVELTEVASALRTRGKTIWTEWPSIPPPPLRVDRPYP